MSNAPRDSAIHPGARQIVRRCLGLEPGQDLVIFLDETTIEVAIALAEAAHSLGVNSSLVLTPVSFQRRIPRQAAGGRKASNNALRPTSILGTGACGHNQYVLNGRRLPRANQCGGR